MFRATYTIIKDQFSSIYSDRCSYSKIILAPLTSVILLYFFNFITTTHLASISSNHTSYLWLTIIFSTLYITVIALTPFYFARSIVQTIRLTTLKEKPFSLFSLYLFKQTYLLVAYIILSMYLFAFIASISSFSVALMVIIETIMAWFFLTAYAYNYVSVAADVDIRFYRINYDIGYWCWQTLMINLFYVLVAVIIYNIHAMYTIPSVVLASLTYFLTINLFGTYGRSYLDWKNHQAK